MEPGGVTLPKVSGGKPQSRTSDPELQGPLAHPSPSTRPPAAPGLLCPLLQGPREPRPGLRVEPRGASSVDPGTPEWLDPPPSVWGWTHS